MKTIYSPLTLVIVLGASCSNKLKTSEADYFNIHQNQTLQDYRLRKAFPHPKEIQRGKKLFKLSDQLLSQYRFIVLIVGVFDSKKIPNYLLAADYNQTSYSLLVPLPFIYTKTKALMSSQSGQRQLLMQADSAIAAWQFSLEFANIHQYLAETMVCACVEDIQYTMHAINAARTFTAYFHNPSQIADVVYHLKQRLNGSNDTKGYLLVFYHDHQCELKNYAALCESLNEQFLAEDIQADVINMPKDRYIAGKKNSKIVFLHLQH